MLSIAADIMPLECILTFKLTADIRKLTNLSGKKKPVQGVEQNRT